MSIERVTAVVVERAERGDALSPAALVFLVRRYLAASEPDVSGVLGQALAGALAPFDSRARPLAQGQPWADRSTLERAEWLRAFTEAIAVSEDPRLTDAARELIAGLAAEWPALSGVEGPSAAIVADAAASVEACLVASHLVDAQVLVPRAIDELERIVGAVYHPGQPVGDAADHVCLASALLTAYEVTGRLPYSMLAEELMQTARSDFGRAGFVTRCLAVHVLGRLAALHDDASYRGAAVIKAEADYRRDATRLLETLADSLDDPDVDVARYGLALDEIQPHRSS